MIELHRLPDWRVRLNAFINGVRKTPFAWADFDCGPEFSGRAVEAVTGQDVSAPFRGAYKSVKEAKRLIDGTGAGDLADLVATLLPEIHPSQAHVGDIAAIPVDGPFGWSLGVVNGERIFAVGADGLMTVPLLAAKRAYRVG